MEHGAGDQVTPKDCDCFQEHVVVLSSIVEHEVIYAMLLAISHKLSPVVCVVSLPL